jgi:DNA-binding CsgD family transcriptional regulator
MGDKHLKHSPLHFQLLAPPHSNCRAFDPASIDVAIKRLALLMPEATSCDFDDLPVYALRYIERYHDDVLQLEMGWEVLYAALVRAWERKDYTAVVSLVAGMAQPAGRICSMAEAERLLQMGIEASRCVRDNLHHVYFLNRLGGLLYTHASYWLGRQVWSASLQLAASSTSTFGLWRPLANFAHIADILGNYSYAKQFVEAILSARHVDEPDSLAVVLFIRGFYARLLRDTDNAREDFRGCLQLLSNQVPAHVSSPDRRLFVLVVQTELARAEGDYARSHACAEAALALAQVSSDRYTIAALLFDQGLYAHAHGCFADIPPIFLRLRDIAQRMKAPRVYHYCHFLGQYAIGYTQETRRELAERHSLATSSLAAMTRHEPLSKREQEVLHLAAAGLSNREIAERLVIERATVKKHLEHIFIKLEVHNRTSAIARARTIEVIP